VTGATGALAGTDDVVFEVVAAAVGLAADFCFLTWCLTLAVFVVVSDFGADATAGGATATSGWVAATLLAADVVAGVSSAAIIPPVPRAAPTPVAAVIRRTRRRT
jgi:hypothetical protein